MQLKPGLHLMQKAVRFINNYCVGNLDQCTAINAELAQFYFCVNVVFFFASSVNQVLFSCAVLVLAIILGGIIFNFVINKTNSLGFNKL